MFYYRFMFKGKPYQGRTGCHRLFDARETLLAIKTEKAKEAKGLVVKKVPTFGEAVTLWYKSRVGKRSQAYLNNAKRQMELHVIPQLGHIRCDQITAMVVGTVVDQYLGGESKQTIKRDGKIVKVGSQHNIGGYNTLLSWISAVLGNLVPDHMPSAPKLKQVKQQEKAKAFVKKGQVDAFLAKIDETDNLHLSVAVRAMLYLGLRESEALSMAWQNLSFEDQTYTPGASGNLLDTTKGKETVPLPVPADMLVWFEKVRAKAMAQLPDNAVLMGWIIPAEDGQPHRKQFTKKAVIRGGKAISLVLTPHRLRGTFATLLAKNKTSPYVIKDLLRQKQLSTTLKYVQIGLEDMKEASDSLWSS